MDHPMVIKPAVYQRLTALRGDDETYSTTIERLLDLAEAMQSLADHILNDPLYQEWQLRKARAARAAIPTLATPPAGGQP